VGCPCDWVINAGYRFWYGLGTVVPLCVFLSVTRLFAILSARHVNTNANLIRHPPRCQVIVFIFFVRTLSAVHQWVGYLVVARQAILLDRII
jgi:hypothetical protein